jgi:hypothetical protein
MSIGMAGGEGGFVPEIDQRDFLAEQQRSSDVVRSYKSLGGDERKGH